MVNLKKNSTAWITTTNKSDSEAQAINDLNEKKKTCTRDEYHRIHLIFS